MDADELAKHPIFPRGNVWWVRRVVPVDLARYPGQQVRKSLETGDRAEAIRAYPDVLRDIDLDLDRQRAELHEHGNVVGALALGKIELLSRTALEGLVLDWFEERAGTAAKRLPDPLDHHATNEALALLEEDAWALTHVQPGQPAAVEAITDRLLVRAGVPAKPRRFGKLRTRSVSPRVNRGSAQYAYLCELVERALLTENEKARDYLRGSEDAGLDPLFHPNGKGPEREISEPDIGRRVIDLIAAYRSERVALYGEESTARKYDLLFQIVKEVVGANLPVRHISREHCVEVLTFLKSLPPNWTKRKELRNLTLRAAMEHARLNNLPGLAPKTVASYMQNFSALLRWGERRRWGVAPYLTERLIERRAVQTKRRGFDAGEMERLFQGLLKFKATQPARFWVPALAAYTGARAGEICQLHVADITDVDGVKCLNLTVFDADGRRAPDKFVKTEASERLVPLHPALVDAGFLDFVESRGGERRLFHELKAGSKGSYSFGFSKWFGTFKRSLGFHQGALVFHSFRHGFRDACRRADTSEETALALGGWTGINQATEYGDRALVPVTNRAIQKIEYGSFRLPSG